MKKISFTKIPNYDEYRTQWLRYTANLASKKKRKKRMKKNKENYQKKRKTATKFSKENKVLFSSLKRFLPLEFRKAKEID